MTERLPRPEGHRINFEAFSPTLTNKILALRDNLDDIKDIPVKVVASFKKRSEEDRKDYWDKKEPDTSFGQRIQDWLPGVASWVDK